MLASCGSRISHHNSYRRRKFDALRGGHRELAIQASKVGAPFRLSFEGMAEASYDMLSVLNLTIFKDFQDNLKQALIAKCDRSRVLLSWAPYCGNLVPAEVQIEFSSVRHLTPQQFVEKLSKELGAVAGRWARLCEEQGMRAYIISSVMDKNQDHRSMNSSDLKDKGQVPSTRVRQALAIGDVKYVSELLVHRHRLISTVGDQKELTKTSRGWSISFPKSYLSNPREGKGIRINKDFLL
uniref:Uncharacterized protein n=1 Tax=Populus alba TaxID=43335 RepID=A0A4U5N8A0_POPAL|nr:hypothetical protein D5086_0000279700 [Populus alba]